MLALLTVLMSSWLASASQCTDIARDFKSFECCPGVDGPTRCGETSRANVWSQLFGRSKGVSGSLAASEVNVTLIPATYSVTLNADTLDEGIRAAGVVHSTHVTQQLASTLVSQDATRSILVLGRHSETVQVGSKRYTMQQVKVGNLTLLALKEDTRLKWGLRYVPGCYGPSNGTWAGVSGEGCVPFDGAYLRITCADEASASLLTYSDPLCSVSSDAVVHRTDECFDDFTLSCRSVPLDRTPRPPAALLDLYRATDGEHWSEPWDLATDYCEWSGVQCSSSGHVFGLFLENRSLTGSLPDSIATLVDVEDMWLNDNQLSGTIPPLGGLSSLYTLDLSRNQFTGGMSGGFTSMSDLEYLGMSSNQLSGPVSPELPLLTQLYAVDLSQNQLDGTIPAFDDLEWLEYLLLYQNNLSGTIPNWSNMTSLTFYVASNNNLTGPLPTGLYDSHRIEYVDLSANRLTGTISGDIHNLPELNHFDLSYNLLSGSLPPELGHCPLLTYVSLAFNQLTGQIPEEITELTGLTDLYLRSNSLSGSLPLDFGSLTALNVLSLRFNQLQGSIPSLARLTNLEFLYLANNNWTSEIPDGVCTLPKLVKPRCSLGEVTCPDPSIACEKCYFQCAQSRRTDTQQVTQVDRRSMRAHQLPTMRASRRGGRGSIGGMLSIQSFFILSGGGHEGPM